VTLVGFVSGPITRGNLPPKIEIEGYSMTQAMTQGKPVVIIVGGGFGGLAAARALKNAPVRVLLIDRSNHHLFQPLLYQVATSVLAPGQIAAPIREILRHHDNTTVILGTVVDVEAEARNVIVDTEDRVNVPLHYDYLILATGVGESYFGHDEYKKYAPGLKTLADAVALRNKILMAFEMAEASDDLARRKDLLTFVLVGAGPTGVEMASAIAILVKNTLKRDFRRIDPATARIVLVDRSKRVLGAFSPKLSEAAQRRLTELGVEVLLEKGVESIDETGVSIDGMHIKTKTVIWTAGVAPSAAGKWLNAETDKTGRVRVQGDLSVREHPEVFVIGDTAHFEQDGEPLPGVAQVALQQGKYAARIIRSRIEGRSRPSSFRYFDKGNLAVVGKGFAVLQTGKVKLSGFFAWIIWAAIHIQFLATTNLRLSVFVQWVWTYLTNQRGSQLIVKYRGD
jgi:NADH:quinone reductase (non-electrogenic)